MLGRFRKKKNLNSSVHKSTVIPGNRTQTSNVSNNLRSNLLKLMLMSYPSSSCLETNIWCAANLSNSEILISLSLSMASSSAAAPPPPHGSPLKIGIIGFGPFAQFLAKIMIKQGHSLTATSRSDHSDVCSPMGIKFFREVKEFFEAGNQVILLCTSILSLDDVLRSIPIDYLRKAQLFVDVLSVKEYPKDLLLNVLPEEADVLCTHPMFGPESGREGWKGLPLVIDRVRIRDHDLCDRYLGIFLTEGCRMVEMSCQEHDKVAAESQFLTHTVGRILAEMEIESTPMDTKGFQTLLQLRDNTMKNSYDLYCGLFECNKFARQELEKLELALQAVKRKLVERTNRKEPN